MGISIIHYNEDTDKKFGAAERLSTMRNGGFEGYYPRKILSTGWHHHDLLIFHITYVKSSFLLLAFYAYYIILIVFLLRRFDTDISRIRILLGIYFIWNSQFVSLLFIIAST